MKWEKIGLIFNAKGAVNWAEKSALQPTPLVLDDRIRVYAGFRDADGVSRVGFVDLDKSNPSNVIGVSPLPALDIGVPGAFDEFGVVPSAVIAEGDAIYMFYAGYQRGLKVRFLVLGGLAVSRDGGETFRRASEVPVFERTDDDLLFRVPHTVMRDGGVFRFWYGGGSKFSEGKSKTLPVYDVRYLESESLSSVPKKGRICLKTLGDEYRVGRPYVVKKSEQYFMFYGYSTEVHPYRLGLAVSNDGLDWKRVDAELGLDLSPPGSIDSEMMAYPAFFKADGHEYLLYSGNNYGEDGFCLAKLISW